MKLLSKVIITITNVYILIYPTTAFYTKKKKRKVNLKVKGVTANAAKRSCVSAAHKACEQPRSKGKHTSIECSLPKKKILLHFLGKKEEKKELMNIMQKMERGNRQVRGRFSPSALTCQGNKGSWGPGATMNVHKDRRLTMCLVQGIMGQGVRIISQASNTSYEQNASRGSSRSPR